MPDQDRRLGVPAKDARHLGNIAIERDVLVSHRIVRLVAEQIEGDGFLLLLFQ